MSVRDAALDPAAELVVEQSHNFAREARLTFQRVPELVAELHPSAEIRLGARAVGGQAVDPGIPGSAEAQERPPRVVLLLSLIITYLLMNIIELRLA